MDRVGDLTLFLRVLDLGSITAAAHSLDLSVAVASQRLKRLEKDLGVRLLHRTTRRLHPTPEGLALAQQGRVLVEELESLGSGLREAASDVAGTLRVTMSASFGRQYVSPLLPAFLARHPKLRLSIHLSDNVVDLVSEGFDLAIRIGALDDSRLVARRIAPNRRVLCAAPAYLARRGNPQTPEELQLHDCLSFAYPAGDDWHSVEKQWRLSGPDGEVAVAVNGPMLINSSAGLHQAARTGMGIVMLPDALVEQDLENGKLIALMPDFLPPSRPMSLMYAQDRYRLPKLRRFVDFAMQMWGKH